MKTTILKLLLLLFISSTITSCNSNDDDTGFTPTLPPITQTGANTFGCLIDGTVFVPRNGDGTFNSVSNGADYFVTGNTPLDYNSSLSIHDYKSSNAGFFQLNIEDVQNGIGEYLIKESNCQEWVSGNPNATINILYSYKKTSNQNISIYCSIENSGTLEISRYDIPNRIISGTFSCSAINRDNPNDIIEITDGRFDINWSALHDTVFP